MTLNDIKIQSFSKVINDIFSHSNIQSFVLETIRKRIYQSGIVGSGQKLKTDKSRSFDYSDATMKLKDWFNQRNENVTLNDTGAFYNSFKFTLNLFGFEIDANFKDIHNNFTMLYPSKAEFEKDVMSLTDTEIDNLMETKILPQLIEKLII